MTRRIACSLLLLASLAHAQSRAGANSRFFGRLGGGSGGGGGTTSRQFTAVTDNLSTPTLYLDNASQFTIAFWFKSADTSQTNSIVSISFTNFGNQVTVQYGYSSSGGLAQIEFFRNGGSGGIFNTGSQITIPDTNWHHIAYRYTGIEWAYFLDGVKTVIDPAFTGTLPTAASATFYIGHPTVGALMSVARYLMSTDALTDGQIAALADSTCSSSGDTNVVAYWLLGQGSPEPESAPSPNTNSLTVSGTVISTGPTCSGS